ncbi:MAG: aminopeptidase N [Thalassobaculales bacterium]
MERGATGPKAVNRLDYRPPDYAVEEIALTVSLADPETLVTARMRVRRREGAGAPPLVLDGQNQRLVSVAIDGRPLAPAEYVLEPERLVVADVPAAFEIEIVSACRPQDNTALEGLYRSGGLYCTQCEAEGFRHITYFVDRPDVMALFTTRIEADRAAFPVLLSNGNPVDSGEMAGGRHYAVWQDPFRKPCYLFALVAGRLAVVEDSFTTRSGRKVALRIYVEPGNEGKCGHAMRSLKQAMAWDEQVFGLEYDLDIFMIVAVSDFNMGAMENKGLNIFNAKYVLAEPDSATDTDYNNILAIVAHEYFHNWTGNRVTCRDWFQLSLKEGLTVFRDQMFTADHTDPAVKRIADVRALRAAQFPEDAGPMAHPVRPDSYIEINNFYTATVYEKGAEVVGMYHTLLGPEGFRKGMDLYFARHDGQAVTCDDFLAAMADANGTDLSQFALWYAQAGTPVVSAKGDWDAAAQRYTLTLSQRLPPTPGQPDKKPQHIPVRLGLVGPDGADMPLRLEGENAAAGTTRTLSLTAASQTFVFADVAARPLPSLFRGFSAPVKLEADFSDADLAFLAGADSDPFNRWEAGQMLARRCLLRLVSDRAQDRPLALDPGLIAAFGRTLADPGLSPAFKAQALLLPTETDLAEAMATVDVEGIHAVREFARRTLAGRHEAALLATYRADPPAGAFSVDPAAQGRRALRNLALGYLMSRHDEAALALCKAQFDSATNMTDSVAALTFLADTNALARVEALEAFYRRWKDDPLVLNKWFAIQAWSKRQDTLSQVQQLLKHPAFDIRNPNKVYGLIGAFAGGNTIRFHDAGGAGYRFLADQVLTVDRLNGQVAARLFAAFTRWRRYDAGRQALMRAEIERVLATPGLSRDVYEIASKSLA